MSNLLQAYYFNHHNLNFPPKQFPALRELTFQYGHFKEENPGYVLKYINSNRQIICNGQFFVQRGGPLINGVPKANWFSFFEVVFICLR